MLFLALSCLQSRRQGDAFAELSHYPVDGVQLTPGCLPTPGFKDAVRASGKAIRFHHGFAWDAYRRPIYDAQRRPLALEALHSVHPPSLRAHGERIPATGGRQRLDAFHCRGAQPVDGGLAWLEVASEERLLVETMYPGEILGTGTEIERALDLGVRLAVDVSHLYMQQQQGAMNEGQLARLLDSDLIEEVHVSDNNGRRDQHRSLRRTSYLLDWAVERGAAGVPLVLESYWHRTEEADRLAQLELLIPRG